MQRVSRRARADLTCSRDALADAVGNRADVTERSAGGVPESRVSKTRWADQITSGTDQFFGSVCKFRLVH